MKPQSASVKFKGVGVLLSAQTAYDRELVMDYVRGCARAQRGVRLRIGRETWRIEPVESRDAQVCCHCRRPIVGARCYAVHRGTVECVGCALSSKRRPMITSPFHRPEVH